MSSDSESPLRAAPRTEEFDLDDVARRLCWWQSPAEARRDRLRFVAQVMALGTDRDVETLARALGEEMFDRVLDAPPPGLFSPRRWNYWHVRRRRLPTPAMPVRFPVKVSFFGGLTFGQVQQPEETVDGVMRVASLPDLFATKLNTIYQRAEARDYLDIHALLASGLTLVDGLAWVKTIYGSDFNTLLPLQALCYFQEPSLRELPQSVKDDLVRAVQALD